MTTLDTTLSWEYVFTSAGENDTGSVTFKPIYTFSLAQEVLCLYRDFAISKRKKEEEKK